MFTVVHRERGSPPVVVAPADVCHSRVVLLVGVGMGLAFGRVLGESRRKGARGPQREADDEMAGVPRRAATRTHTSGQRRPTFLVAWRTARFPGPLKNNNKEVNQSKGRALVLHIIY